MRNYFDALGIDRNSNAQQTRQAIDTLTPEQLEYEGDLATVLETVKWQEQYNRVHLQYEAIAAVLSKRDAAATQNATQTAHSWEKRVVEFTAENDTIELD